MGFSKESLEKLPVEKNELPKPFNWRTLIGPSFIILGLGLGSGEVILWPYLASNYGLGIIWAALIGITIQFLINMEVERYALIYGESIFVGFTRLMKALPVWFIFSTFIGFGWPGIGLAGAELLTRAAGVDVSLDENRIWVRVTAVGIFLLIGAILSFGKVLYKTVENLEKYVIAIGVPFIVLLAIYFADFNDVTALMKGLIGQGEGYNFLPEGIILTTFLGGLAYAGAGGNLNLAQSFYVRDKGYGMGKYAQKIKSIFTSDDKQQDISLSGTTFDVDATSLDRFKKWWRAINIEHLIIFWFLGFFTMTMLMLLSYTTTFGLTGTSYSISFVIKEAEVIAQQTLPFLGTLFLLITGVMLSSTQLTVLDSTSRIMTENYLLVTGKKKTNVSKVFYVVLWIQIIFGISVVLLGFDQPLVLITLGAVLNAMAMFVYIGLILFMNNTVLHKALRPSWWRNLLLTAAFIFFGVFSYLTIVQKFFS